MEGSVAAAGQGGQGEAGGGAEQQQQGGAFDASQLVTSLSAIAEGQNETRELLRSLAQQQEAGTGEGGENEGELDPFSGLDLSFLEETPQAEQVENPQQFTQQLGGVLSQAIQNALQQDRQSMERDVIAPLRSEVGELRREAAVEALASEFPQLADPGTAEEVVGLSQRLAQANGQPELGDQPWFWRLTFMAAEAAAAANDAGGNGADPSAANLETGAGALPGGSGSGDMGDAIVGAKRGASVLPTF